MSAKAQTWSRLNGVRSAPEVGRRRCHDNSYRRGCVRVNSLCVSRVFRQVEKGEPADDIAACINYRYELLHIWLPQTLTQLVTGEAQTQFVRLHEETRCVLDPQDPRKACGTPLTVRVHQAGCEASDVSYVRRLNNNDRYFPELLDILASAAGTSSCGPTSEYSTASVHIFADQFLKAQPPRSWRNCYVIPLPIRICRRNFEDARSRIDLWVLDDLVGREALVPSNSCNAHLSCRRFLIARPGHTGRPSTNSGSPQPGYDRGRQ